MYGLEEARHQYEALRGAAEVSPVLQVRAHLFQMGREWQRAGALLKDLSTEIENEAGEATGEFESAYTIVVAGAVVGGMMIAAEDDPGSDRCTVIRSMQRDGQLSLHVTHTRSPAGSYINLTGPASPVVVVA